MTRPLRIFYAAGPGDVIGTYRHWKNGEDDPSQVAITYSGQFYDLIRDIGAVARVVSWHPRREKFHDDRVWIEHRPVPFPEAVGPLYHSGQLWYGLRLVASAVRYRADVVISMGGGAWYTFGLLPLFGIKVIVALHGHLREVARQPRGFSKLLWALNRRFFRRTPTAVLFVSDSVAQQLLQITGPVAMPVVRFTPTYRREMFDGAADVRPAPRPFRVLFAGRMEENKGVFQLLEIARGYAAAGRADIEFDLAGSGTAVEPLRQQAEAAGIATRFRCHGHVDKPGMRRLFEQAHAVVAPTTTGSVEGLNKVVVESVLAGRPVVTSRVCPALEYVRDAVVEVPPDEAKGYGEAILRLADDQALYEEKVRGCTTATGQFYDMEQSWYATMKRVLQLVGLVPGDGQKASSSAAPVPSASHAVANAR